MSHRPAPMLGALIAAAATLYAARHAADRPPQRRPAASASPPPRPGWARILANVWRELDRDVISVMAAGVAFYSFLSIFPAMSALISIYGLVADPAVIEQQISALGWVLPHAALQLISDQLHALIAAPQGSLGLSLIISLLITFWSAMFGTSTLMQALTAAYEGRETRGILAFYLQSAGLTIAFGGFGLVSLFLVAVVPAAIEWLPLPAEWASDIALIRWPILAGLALLALALVYRFAPARQHSRWHLFDVGTVAAALLWLLASAGFSYYVARFATYNKTYGSLGAVAVLMVWFYVSAYIVLLGAEINSEVEKARR